jgi:hypothetical protein
VLASDDAPNHVRAHPAESNHSELHGFLRSLF